MFGGGMFILKGILGIVFGLLLIVVPDFTLGAFLTIFGLLLIGAGIISFMFAVTSQQTDTIFWFLVSGAIILLGILTLLPPFSFFISAFFALIIAGWALITGIWDLGRFICSSKKFYGIMVVVIIVSLVLIGGVFYYVPLLREHYVATILGTFAAVLGFFSLVLGELIISGRIPECLSPVPPKTKA